MRPFFTPGKQQELIRRCDECLVAHRHRLLACARRNADAHTDIDLLLADTVRRVARVFCKRPMGEELLLRYTLRSLRNAARHEHMKNCQRFSAESGFSRDEELNRRPGALPDDGPGSLHARLADLLEQLPAPYATVLHLKLWDELTFAAIARQLGVSESTARRQYETAIEMLRTRMQRDQDE